MVAPTLYTLVTVEIEVEVCGGGDALVHYGSRRHVARPVTVTWVLMDVQCNIA